MPRDCTAPATGTLRCTVPVVVRGSHTDNNTTDTIYAMAGGSKSRPANSNALARSSKKTKRKANGASAPSAVSSRGVFSGPKISGQSGGITKFSNIEYTTDVVTSVGSGAPSITLTFNAANSTTFPWLSRVAQGFEVYRFRRARVIYTPSCSSTTSGLVVGAFEFDANDAAPQTKQQLSAMDASARTNVWNKGYWDMPCPNGWYYCSPTGPIVGDTRLNDVGRFFLGVYGTASSGQTIGELTIQYDVEFAKPEMANYNLSERIDYSGSTIADPVGTLTLSGDAVVSVSSSGTGSISFTMLTGGNYIMELISVVSTSSSGGNQIWSSLALSRNGLIITGGATMADYTSSYVSGAPYSAMQIVTISALVGDVITFAAAAYVTALQLVRTRIAPYKALG